MGFLESISGIFKGIINFCRNNPLVGLLVGGALIILAINLFSLPQMITSQDWPTTKGTIISSEAVPYECYVYEDGWYDDLSERIIFKYSVNNKQYTSDVISSSKNTGTCPNPDYAREVVSRYPEGADVSVYYNPRDPSEGMLEPGFEFESFAGLLFCFAMNGMAALMLLASIVSLPKYILMRWTGTE